MDPLLHLPLAAIDPHALLRDRTALAPEPLAQLQRSIATEGLRMPVEVWELSTPRNGHTHGLISGLRRLTACTALGHSTIPAFLRSPQSVAQALATMVSENENREPVSPWEKATLILTAMEEGHFDTPDAAIAALYPTATRQTRTRLRAYVEVATALDGTLATPERLSIERMERLATALRLGGEEVLTLALIEAKPSGLTAQWHAVAPLITDLIASPPDSNEPGTPKPRPRRLLQLKQGLTIRREVCRGGYLLKFTGPEARQGGLIDDVLDKVEEWFGKG